MDSQLPTNTTDGAQGSSSKEMTTRIATVKPKRRPLSRGWFAAVVIGGALLASTAGTAAVLSLYNDQTTQVVNNESVVLQEGELVADVADKVSPSVVSIVTESSLPGQFGSPIEQSAGSGIIISNDGYIVTNKHVVSSSNEKVQVILADGTSYENVTFVGSDPSNDIAFLKIQNVSNLVPASLGDSAALKVGQKVIAIGNALGQYQNTVTTGIISGTSRPVTASDSTGSAVESLENLLQTDAAINPGNSGGPLVNLEGKVIGINTAVASDAEGIGFAIPINDVKGMIKTLLSDGKVVKPYIGVRYASITPDVVKRYNLDVKDGGYIISSGNAPAVASGSPADKAGLKAGDIITKIGETAVDSAHPFASLVAQHSVGETVTLTYIRDGKTKTVDVTLAARE